MLPENALGLHCTTALQLAVTSPPTYLLVVPTLGGCILCVTLMLFMLQVIDLGDNMEFTKLPEGAAADKLICSDPTIPHDDSNLVIKVGDAKWHVTCCMQCTFGSTVAAVSGTSCLAGQCVQQLLTGRAASVQHTWLPCCADTTQAPTVPFACRAQQP